MIKTMSDSTMINIDRLGEIEAEYSDFKGNSKIGDVRGTLLVGEMLEILPLARVSMKAKAAPNEVEAAIELWDCTANCECEDDDPEYHNPHLRKRKLMRAALQAAAVWRKAHEG